MAAAAVAGGASLSSLPTDVLAHLFAFVPLRARQRILARTCRRWRLAALLSVRALLIESAAPDLQRTLPHFANLTTVHVRDLDPVDEAALTLPPSVEQLILNTRACISAPFPPALSSLDLVFCAFSTSSDLIRACTTSLRSLKLHLGFNEEQEADPLTLLSETHFPRLTTLKTVPAANQSEEHLVLLRRHATQLQALSLDLGDIQAADRDAFLALHFPRLRRLTVRGLPLAFLRWHALHASISDLRLLNEDDTLDLAPVIDSCDAHILNCLTRVSVAPSTLTMATAHFLDAHSNQPLYHTFTFANSMYSRATLGRLKNVHIPPEVDALSLLPLLTCATRLRLPCISQLPYTLLSFSLPAVRTLGVYTLEGEPGSFPAIAELLKFLLLAMPRVCRIEVTYEQELTLADVGVLRSLLDVCLRHGVWSMSLLAHYQADVAALCESYAWINVRFTDTSAD